MCVCLRACVCVCVLCMCVCVCVCVLIYGSCTAVYNAHPAGIQAYVAVCVQVHPPCMFAIIIIIHVPYMYVLATPLHILRIMCDRSVTPASNINVFLLDSHEMLFSKASGKRYFSLEKGILGNAWWNAESHTRKTTNGLIPAVTLHT